MTALPDGTAMGTYLVTRGEFTKYVEAEKITFEPGCVIRTAKDWRNDPATGWTNPGFPQEDDHPVVCVTWLDATAYADWLSGMTGQSYRLPTFEESAAAAAAGSEATFWWGDDFAEVCAHANSADAEYRKGFPDDPRKMVACSDGFLFTSPVNAFPANGYGLYDVTGNVWEWTNSCLNGDCANAIFRGAAWTVPNPDHFKTTGQWADRIVLRNSAVGFRVMRDAAK
jgi:formylglycine-generating enzyme required for sulfatase activity